MNSGSNKTAAENNWVWWSTAFNVLVSKQINKDKPYKNAFNNKMVKQWTKISITSVYVCVYICIYMYIYILLITYKSIHGLAPEYLTELIKLKTSGRYHLRSCDKLLLDCPRIKTRVTLGDRSFAIAAPTLWNSLPMEVRYLGNNIQKTS